MNFYSQANQDKWVVESLKGKRNGYFLDIGACYGIHSNNTYTLESELGWNGICIEAGKGFYSDLVSTRKSICVNKAVLDYCGECKFGIGEINTAPFEIIQCDTLENILKEYNAPHKIDYMSIDIEGCEYTALKDFPFDIWNISLITIEHNSYIDGGINQKKLFELLSKNGFIRAVKDVPCLDANPAYYMKPFEDWYVNKSL
jgi:FkbM family methyltransferase